MSLVVGRVGTLSLDGYRSTRVLRDSGRTRVFAAIRESDRRAVLVKLYELDSNEGVEVRVEHEFRTIQGLELDGVVEVLALERGRGYVALVSDWCDGVNLDEYRGGQPISIADFMLIAQQLASLLAEIHRHKVIHRDIKPNNVFIGASGTKPGAKTVWLADFGISVLLERERQRIDDAWVVESSLPYVSPEQTGRTHHEVDFRSDLYSLGVTLYELLTGRRPFDASTPLELIHAHLARRPQAPQRLRPELPTSLSAIVMKLLEKAPERRYQSARGLLADLERIAEAFASGTPLEGFALATSDVPAVLQLPHRLYGRSREVEKLSEAFRDACRGTPRCVFVSGATGLGKTALVNQLAEPVMSRRGLFARGKFEREQLDKPYSGVFAAFSNLADQLLTRSDAQLGHWRERLRERLGSSGTLLNELVPRLRPMLSPINAGPELGPLESRNQLALACAGLIAEFARVEHPLVLCLDDFQWADEPSCELIAALLVEPEAALLVVVTLREAELAGGSPVFTLIGEIGEAGVDDSQTPNQFSRIALEPLGRDDVAALIADTLAWPIERVRPLADIVGRNTSHNPFFVGQYLSHLVDLGLLRPSPRGWDWDAEAIEAAGIPEDLLTMMTAKLRLLNPEQQALLSAAAVIGARFDIAGLRALVGPEIAGRALVPLTREGLLTTLRGGRYGFTHDRIREAAYQMTSADRRVELHRIVGEDCLERSGYGEIEESILEVVDHLDIGCGLAPIGDEDPELSRARAIRLLDELEKPRRELLAELNAIAGHNALIGAAPRAAVRYFEAGIQLVAGVQDFASANNPPDNASYLDDELRFALELGRCQALGLAGQTTEAERHFERVLRAPLDVARTGRAVAARVEIRIAAGDRRGAIDCGMDGLSRLGVEPIRADAGPKQFPLNRLVPMLRSPALRALAELAPVHDSRLEAALEILSALIPVSALVDPDLHAAIVTEHIEIMLAYGRHRAAPTALSYAAMFVGTAVGQRTLALEIVELARVLLSGDGPGLHRQRIEPPYWVVASWVRPYAEALAPLRDSVNLALAAGDLENAGYATNMSIAMSLSAGVPLQILESSADSATRRLRQWQAGPLFERADAYLRFARGLLSGDEASVDCGPLRDVYEHRSSHYMVRLLRGMSCCLLGHWQAAFTELDAMDDFQRVVSGAWYLCDFATFHGLSAAALHSTVRDPDERERLVWVLRLSLELLETSAELAPANCVARAALLEAELCAIEGRSIEALAAFTKARRAAAEQHLTWLEAIAAERSSVHLRSLGLDELADGPLRDARERYNHWGAFSKAAQIDRLHPELAEDRGAAIPLRRMTTSTGPSVSASRALDLQTILKASQAIAGDIQLEDVVGRVMAIAIENAGAERGALLLPGDAGLELTAVCSAEGSSVGLFREPMPVEDAANRIPTSVLRWVERTREPAILADATRDMRFATDPYIAAHGVRSILCLPIVKHERLIGLLYLENKLNSGSFTSDRLELLHLLMAQAASALENAQLFEALRDSEVRWRSLVEGLPDVVMLVDHNGRVEFINHSHGHSHGEQQGEPVEKGERQGVIGSALDALVDPEHSNALHEQMTRAIREASQTELELRAALRSSKPRWYSLRLAPIAVDGRVERIVAVATDITERREAALAKEQLEAQIRQQQRLESIGTLASGVAHEINNPVQGIMNYAELIATMPDINDDAREFAGEIGYESQRVATIVRSLLSFSREENEDATGPVDIKEIIDGTLSLVRTLIGKDQIALSVAAPEQAVLVECRAQQIRQVIMNLVTNARDAVCARWPDYHEDKRIDLHVQTFTDNDGRGWVRISVCDRGGGVPPGVIDRIFDPFFTTKGRDQGTGLGLAVSHGIISEHGGELRLENHVGIGACFHIELPCEAG